MIIIAKRSGESLNVGAQPGQPWTTEGRQKTLAELASLSLFTREANDQGVTGAALVVGAGNLAMRGEQLRAMGVSPRMADQMGMIGTLWNAQVIADDLDAAGVPHRLLVAKNVKYRMPGMPELEVATPKSLRETFKYGELAVIGAGSGMLDQTTDAAAIDHGRAYRESTGNRVCILKATKFAGVYDADPAKNPGARLLSRVSAATMAENGWSAVDPQCLRLVQDSGIEIRVHAASDSFIAAVAGEVGTLIVPQPNILQYAA